MLHTPMITINGTAKDSLLHDYHNIISILEKAKDVIRNAAPHPRDTYIPGDYGAARQGFVHVLTVIDSLIFDFRRVQENIDTQGE